MFHGILIVEDKGRLGIHRDFASLHVSQALLIYCTIAGHNSVVTCWDVYILRLTTAIQNDNDIIPIVSSGMVCEHKAYNTGLHWQET